MVSLMFTNVSTHDTPVLQMMTINPTLSGDVSECAWVTVDQGRYTSSAQGTAWVITSLLTRRHTQRVAQQADRQVRYRL